MVQFSRFPLFTFNYHVIKKSRKQKSILTITGQNILHADRVIFNADNRKMACYHS